MLQIKNISKKYVTGDLTQIALNDVSLNLRDNEFVAILGPSGSGKTTLLNVIGGLDRYDSGDLIINGISTKKYNDRDWDSYRNHTIGFVFQSYNLIPHQNILSNVELALTISGVSSAERKRRAKEALEKVGLGDQLHKRPNQLSGGQMQRVAIARALVNDPDILLADEPTGALDTKTSVQIMDLLKTVAADKLVVMVTHNPDLANDYANRIVQLKDGEIISDTNPFDAETSDEGIHKNMGRSSMSFLTSLALSFNNLRTKKGRTILTSFAGSIGIIGIALIMALSNGVNTYINNIQKDTLSEYPLTINRSGVDISSFIGGGAIDLSLLNSDAEVKEQQTISTLFAKTNTNDLKALKKYIESDQCRITEYSTAVEYGYNVTPYIYRMIDDKSYRQVNPDRTFANITSDVSQISMMMTFINQSGIFSVLPETDSMYKKQYEVKAGHWPENYNECVLILTDNGAVTDITLYAMGMKDIKKLDELLEKYAKEEEVDFDEKPETYSYKDFLGVGFKMVDATQLYEYDKELKVYVDKSASEKYMLDKVKKGEDLKVVGVVQPVGDSTASMLSPGIAYTSDLEFHVMDLARQSGIAKKQLENKDINVFTGKKFGESDNSVNLSKLFSMDEGKLTDSLSIDDSLLGYDPSSFGSMDLSGLSLDGMDLSSLSDISSGMGEINFENLFKNISVDVSVEGFGQLFDSVFNSYLEEAKKDPSTDYTRLGDSLGKYLQTEEARKIISDHISRIIKNYDVIVPSYDEMSSLMTDVMNGFPKFLSDNNITDINEVPQALDDYLRTDEVRNKLEGFITNIRNQINNIEIDETEITKMSQELYNGYEAYAKKNSLPQISKFTESFSKYLSSEKGQKVLFDGINKVVNLEDLSRQIGEALMKATAGSSGSMGDILGAIMTNISNELGSSLASAFSGIMGNMGSSLSDVFSFSDDSLKDAIKTGVDSNSIKDIMNSMSELGTSDYEDNLRKLNYAQEDDPYSVSIFPKDFENKQKVIDELEKYNTMNKENGKDDKVITYSDTVATLMGSVTTIVDIVSYVLIAFVAISLIVSSIMIGIITYISVLERTKEIGILRAIGASKHNISQVFNAETFIIGFLAGVIGIGLSLLLSMLANVILHALVSPQVSAILPVPGAVILIILSIFLTFIGGFIPSKKAARKDPVTALRTE